jgi:hypothetical protein
MARERVREKRNGNMVIIVAFEGSYQSSFMVTEILGKATPQSPLTICLVEKSGKS